MICAPAILRLGGWTARAADGGVCLVSLPVAGVGAYLGALSLLARERPPGGPDTSLRFTVVIPAHNEEALIADTVRSVLALDYPGDRFRVLVVADNCSDATADAARNAGAEVLERVDPSRRGKGFALALAFDHVLAGSEAPDAVVVVDADTIVSSNLLRAFSAGIAAGDDAMQARYRVANPEATWRTTLMAIAFACIHDVRSLGRERLGVSNGLRGNGMCFTTKALAAAPHRATSLVEDIEHGLDLADAGIRVAYVHSASVLAEMPERADNAVSQRLRWEQGRRQLRSERGPALVRTAVQERSLLKADLAADLYVPPLAQVVGIAGALGLVAAGVGLVRRRVPAATLPLTIAAGGLGVHLVAGWQRSETGVDGLRSLMKIPSYMLWKAGLGRPGDPSAPLGNSNRTADAWVRTTRNAEGPTRVADESAARDGNDGDRKEADR